MTILLLCKMFGVPTSRLTSILAEDWLIHQVDNVCKTFTDSIAIAVVAHLAQGNSAIGLSEIGAEGQKVQKSKLVTFFLL